ncbi:MAG TPA: hypothetical protein VGH93_06810 [Solirubrobacteraceae bacterium]
MAERGRGADGGEDAVELGGYRQELKEMLGSIQVFYVGAFILFLRIAMHYEGQRRASIDAFGPRSVPSRT